MVEDALAEVRAQTEAADAEVKRIAETLEKLRRQVDQTKQAESGSLEGIRPNLEERSLSLLPLRPCSKPPWYFPHVQNPCVLLFLGKQNGRGEKGLDMK